MKRIGLKLLVLGVIVVATGVVVASAAPAAPASPVTTVNANRTPPEGATYVGSNTCVVCHSSEHRNWSNTLHPYMIQDPVANPKVIVADFKAGGEDVRAADIGGQKRAYTEKDVTYTMGNKYRQRYIIKTDKGFNMLPGQWNVKSKKWVAADAGDWLKDCAGCHTTGFDVQKMAWSELGVGCESCHGPASVHVEKARALPKDVKPVSDEIYAVRQAIVKTVDAAVCGQCHTRGTSPDKEHGYPVGYIVGGPLTDKMFIPVAPTGKADDPNFWPDGTEKKHRQQYIAWGATKHAGALETLRKNPGAADYCVGCHSTDFAKQDNTFAQDKVDLKSAQFSLTCVQCHAPHGEAHIDNQLNMDSYDLCVSCHTGTSGGRSPIVVGGEVHHPMREMFEGRSFAGLKPQPSKHYSNEAFGPVCASCHMVGTAKSADQDDIPTHTWKIISPVKAAKGQPDSCTKCHTLEKNKDNTPENLSAYLDKVQKDTKKRVDALTEDLKTIADEHKDWDPKAKDKPKEQVSYERAKTLVSFVETDGSTGFHNPEFTDTILKEAEKLVDTLLK